MTRSEARALRVVLHEGAGARALEPERRFALLEALLAAGYPITRPARGEPVEAVAADGGTELVVLGDFEQRAGQGAVALQGDDGPQDVLARLAGRRDVAASPAPPTWLPWFPVIDYQRCTNCMQCLSFCLFDVYGVDGEGKIQVQNEEKCKTNCPACSRVCPEVAILFPKYKKGPINGDEVRAQDVQKEAMKVDISALLGGDIYASLRERTEAAKKRFSTERDESRALLERKRCLKELRKDLDIPDEVLMTLPSAGEIQERARRAKEKLERRMTRSQTVRDRRATATEEEWGI